MDSFSFGRSGYGTLLVLTHGDLLILRFSPRPPFPYPPWRFTLFSLFLFICFQQNMKVPGFRVLTVRWLIFYFSFFFAASAFFFSFYRVPMADLIS